EMDFLSAEKAVKFRSENGPYTKEEDLLKFIPQDSFMDVFETIEVGSMKSPKYNFFNGNSYSEYGFDPNGRNTSTNYSRYNVYFDDAADLRLSFGQDSDESRINVKEKFVNFYYYTDSYLKKGYKIESAPSIRKIKTPVASNEESQKSNFEYLDGYFAQKVMVGRKKRKKVNGLFESNLETPEKYFLVKKKKKTEDETEAAEEAKNQPAEDMKKDEIIKDIKLDLPDYKKNGGTPGEESARKRTDEVKLLSSVLTLGDVMFPQGKYPLIDLHRTKNSGLKYKKYFQNFDFSVIGSKLSEVNENRLGGNLNFRLQENTSIGGRVEKLWDNDYNHSIDYLHFYGSGKLDNVSVYGEMQNVFNGAESIFAEAMSGFRDINLTTRILSVKENFSETSVTAPYSFDGQFTTFLRLNYNFSDIASFATSFQSSDLKRNNPDDDWGTRKISKFRFLLYPTDKTRMMLTYVDERTPDDIANNIFMTSVRYKYRQSIYLIGKFAITDNDVNSAAGRVSDTSLEWQRRIKTNLKVILKYQNLWDESKLNTDDEFTNIIKFAYFRNF
ncbi:MAG TPA: hypothetical protein PKK26_11710, partial [Candidatus Wallbacteria bacterium]|nr:hypothetical protein [Candidatus Wallbacteria bacterium]